jgi:hypothetical protein
MASLRFGTSPAPRSRSYVVIAVAAICLCCTGRGPEVAHAGGDQRPRQAQLTFTVSETPNDKGAKEAGAMLIVPVPRGAEPSYWGKLASYESRSSEGGGGAGAVAAWNDLGVPSLRIAARARLRDDGLVQLAYAVEALEDAGSLPPPPGSPAGTPAQRVTRGPTLDGDLLLPINGATLTIGEIHDAKGRKLEVKLKAVVGAIE